jgi:N-acetylglucosaminyl-diphospho-decaprenol L-rhamnosyltransferase
MLDATAIVVNYRSAQHVLDLLAHVSCFPEDRPAQWVVVDNCPAEGLGARPELLRPDLDYLALPDNPGFAAAVNRGLALARQRHVLLINPDTLPERGCLAGLLEVLETVPGAAVAGPRLLPLREGDAERPSATVREPGLASMLVEYTIAHRLVPGGRAWLAGRYFADPARIGSPAEVAMVQGACFAFVREWLDRVGDFDEARFFLYWEETDFCRRVRAAGGRVFYCPDLRCRHLGGGSTPDRAAAERYFWRGLYAYMGKHRGRGYAVVLRLLLGLGIGAEYLLLVLLAGWRRGRDARVTEDVALLGRRLRAQWPGGAR